MCGDSPLCYITDGGNVTTVIATLCESLVRDIKCPDGENSLPKDMHNSSSTKPSPSHCFTHGYVGEAAGREHTYFWTKHLPHFHVIFDFYFAMFRIAIPLRILCACKSARQGFLYICTYTYICTYVCIYIALDSRTQWCNGSWVLLVFVGECWMLQLPIYIYLSLFFLRWARGSSVLYTTPFSFGIWTVESGDEKRCGN